ncbi:MAG: hypothetical protein HN353_06280 [Bdellovibrionales bacterium]|jgi:hypothetical protein|nr:hypothetical protein [Bdellovibrionales bacterium]MBT3526240.1 hypothetical protein [Bdellovibrionales bacterium]MBT7669162.1 hypothetical protein [Bdellovibrionales bacterium]
MARRKSRPTYSYRCSLTEAKYRTTREAPNPGELLSVRAYYELHPDEDDRPEKVRREEAELAAQQESESAEMFDELASMAESGQS